MTTDRTLKGQSRIVWALRSDQDLATHEQIQIGALLRIADAAEAMARRHTELIDERDYWERECKLARGRLDVERRRTAALRGLPGKTKKTTTTTPTKQGEEA